MAALNTEQTQALIAVGIELAPKVIDLIRSEFVKRNPDAPVPTDEEIHNAWITERDTTLATDDQWRKDNPSDS